jgi:hypothetical protein
MGLLVLRLWQELKFKDAGKPGASVSYLYVWGWCLVSSTMMSAKWVDIQRHLKEAVDTSTYRLTRVSNKEDRMQGKVRCLVD